jgi:hypothetical protein
MFGLANDDLATRGTCDAPGPGILTRRHLV